MKNAETPGQGVSANFDKEEKIMKHKYGFRLFALLISGFISACGSSSTTTSSVPTTAITGSSFANHVSGASVVVKNSSGTTVAGPVTTGSDGSYGIDIPTESLSGDLIFESSGGTFTDEATGTATTAGTLSAHITGGTLSTGGAVHVTPSTTIIQKLVAAGKARADAETAFNTAFGFIPDSTIAPVDVMNPPTGATEAQKLAGLQSAIFSQLANDLGETQTHILAHLPEDLADDGILNGLPGHLPEDIGNKFGTAFTNFLANSNNHSGLAADKIGSLPFARTALTDSYKIEYIAISPSVNPKAGKTVFKLKITSLAGGSAVSGLTVSLTPTMYMSTKNHTTTVESVVDNGDGTYTCTVYYLMSSSMSGASMGYWELKVSVGSETAYFHPTVDMDMSGGTVKATLKGQSDIISSMSGSEKRSYYIYNDGISMSGMDHFFNLFIAAKESMTSFPPVKVGTVMNSTLTVSSIVVEASTDGTTWVAATDEGNGHWKAGGIGLTHGYAGKIYVKVTINGEQKTTDGNAVSGTNDYATFDFASMSMTGMTH